jgi:short-subunit dehydrogenase involved in D-alanine esterification of teichoic acids
MPIDEIKSDVIDDVIETNLSALIHITRLLLPILRTRDEAAIINISSKS